MNIEETRPGKVEGHSLIFDLALWGQLPTDAKQVRTDWESYLLDYSQHHSRSQTRRATIRAFAAHVWWRVTARSTPTTIPTLLGFAALTVALVLLALVDPIGSTMYADAHFAIGGGLMVAALIRTPWSLPYSRLLVAALLVAGTASVHHAIVIDLPSPAEAVAVVAFTFVAFGAIGAGLSALRTKRPLGQYVTLWWIIGVGTALTAVSNIMAAALAERAVSLAALTAVTFVDLFFLPQIAKLWRLSQLSYDATA